MEVANLIRKFCEEHSDKYYVYENYSGRGMMGAKCIGVVVRCGNSIMTFMFELAKYLDSYVEDIDVTLFESIAYDDLGLDSIAYFPLIQ